jgi:hypothetical protein
MASFLSRLVSSLLGRRRRGKSARTDSSTTEASVIAVPASGIERVTDGTTVSVLDVPTDEAARTPGIVPKEGTATAFPSSLRIGVDFGTSTMQVAVYVEGREPHLLRLEDASDHMPSYYALDQSGQPCFGAIALNVAENVHSIKPKLAEDVEIPSFGYPSQIAHRMLAEVVQRTIKRLRDQGLIPEQMERLDVATNLGCTPRFQLDARTLLRDVAQRAGLDVQLATLVEEPVAAAYEIMLSGMVTDGRVLVVDMGGGTLDIAVIKISGQARSFELFASGGSVRAGDRFTEVIADRIRNELAERTAAADLTRADDTLIWQRAEAAKQSLSVRRTAIVALGGIAGLSDETFELTSDWFTSATGRLRVFIEADVATVYRAARLVLDRGDEHDPAPGTVNFEELTKGAVRRLSEIGLRDDALLHIDTVVLVGGATNMPMIGQLFRSIFGDRVIEPEIVAIDRTAIVAMGLARPKPKATTNLRFPSWGVSALFRGDGVDAEVPVYEPYAPTFHVLHGATSEYSYRVAVPTEAQTVALVFRPVGQGEGTGWPRVQVPIKTQELLFEMDLFGRIQLSAGGADLYGGVAANLKAPWSPAEADGLATWLPPWKKRDWWTDVPTWDMRNDK